MKSLKLDNDNNNSSTDLCTYRNTSLKLNVKYCFFITPSVLG